MWSIQGAIALLLVTTWPTNAQAATSVRALIARSPTGASHSSPGRIPPLPTVVHSRVYPAGKAAAGSVPTSCSTNHRKSFEIYLLYNGTILNELAVDTLGSVKLIDGYMFNIGGQWGVFDKHYALDFLQSYYVYSYYTSHPWSVCRDGKVAFGNRTSFWLCDFNIYAPNPSQPGHPKCDKVAIVARRVNLPQTTGVPSSGPTSKTTSRTSSISTRRVNGTPGASLPLHGGSGVKSLASTSSESHAWIASVVIGVAALVAILLAGSLYLHRRRGSRHSNLDNAGVIRTYNKGELEDKSVHPPGELSADGPLVELNSGQYLPVQELEAKSYPQELEESEKSIASSSTLC